MTQIKSVFGDYATQLQALVDTNLEKFKEPFFPKYFSMGLPKGTLSYATAIGRSRIEAAAAIVAHGSEAPLRSRAGLQKLTGEVAAIKVKREMEENEYRNWLTLRESRMADEAKKQQIIQLIWNDVKHVIDSVNSRIDIMVKNALSSGNVVITAAANPDGAVMGTIDLLVQADNSGNPGSRNGTGVFDRSSASWAATGGDAIADIQAAVDNVAEPNGIEYEKVIITPTKWRQIAQQARTMARFGEEPTLDQINNYLIERKLPYFDIVTGRHSLETNGIIANHVPWDNARVAFVPAGTLGVIHNALAIEEIAPVAGVDYAISGRILVSKWSQTEPFGEFTRGEIAAFPGLEQADQILFVNVENANWA